MSKPKTKSEYYSIPLKRALNMATDAERSMKLFGETVKTYVEKYELDDWSSSPIPDYMDAYLNAKVLRDFIQNKIEKPDEYVTEYLKKNKVDGLIVTHDELLMLYTLSNNFDDSKAYISKIYGFSTMLN